VSKEPLIAVVDDDDSFRLALAESLRSLGYDAREFASAEEFIAGRSLRLRHYGHSHARHDWA
jgi:FixJ family two-component response regulator